MVELDGDFVESKKCLVCGTELESTRTKYCSSHCTRMAQMQRRRKRDAEAGLDPFKTRSPHGR